MIFMSPFATFCIRNAGKFINADADDAAIEDGAKALDEMQFKVKTKK